MSTYIISYRKNILFSFTLYTMILLKKAANFLRLLIKDITIRFIFAIVFYYKKNYSLEFINMVNYRF